MEFTYDGLVRHSFGFYNPNHAAALLSMIIPVLWGLRRYFKNSHLKFSVVCVEIVFYVALVLTYSRTGIGALILSLLFFYALTHFCLAKTEPLKIWGRKSVKIEILIVAGIGLVVAIAALATGSITRYFQWMISPDKSVTNRFGLWKGAFQMIADNPDGVGTGLSGGIFTDFMQAPDASDAYRTMVNSFLTFACEQGLVPFFISAVIVIFIILSAMKIILSNTASFKMKLSVITLTTILFSAFVNGCFSTCFDLSIFLDIKNGSCETNDIMQTFLLLLSVAAVFLLALLCVRHLELFRVKKLALLSLCATTVICLSIFMCGVFLEQQSGEKVRVFVSDGMSFVKIVPSDASAKSFFIIPDSESAGPGKVRSFMAEKYGKAQMTFPLASSSVNISPALLLGNDCLVLCGKNASMEYDFKNSSLPGLRLIYCLPSEKPVGPGLPVHKIYLNEFDEHNVNAAWEKKFPREFIEYCY